MAPLAVECAGTLITLAVEVSQGIKKPTGGWGERERVGTSSKTNLALCRCVEAFSPLGAKLHAISSA